MVKYGIITHYDVHNHGALLQLNGLIKVLKRDFSIDARALQYDKNYDFAKADVKKKNRISIASAGFFVNYILKRGIDLFLFNVKKKHLFSSFIKRENLIGPTCKESKKLDGVVIGSDEVFSLHLGPTPELFGFNLPSEKVFAYAGCFGSTTIDIIKQRNCEKFVRDGLNSMVGLSMRDPNSIYIAKELTGRDSVLVVDPVILYGYEKELSKLKKPKFPKYLLVYAYESRLNEASEYQPILDYAHRNGLIVVCPGFFHRWADININTDPIELLRYFKYAEYSVTDTFHGCVLSIITGCDMAVKIRDNANKLFNLMKEYNIESRTINEKWDLTSIFDNKVDWDIVKSQITKRRAVSMDFLKSMIEK